MILLLLGLLLTVIALPVSNKKDSFPEVKSSSFFSSMTQIGPISPLLCPRKTPVIALSCHLSTTPMKYTNWVEFKINVMELFIHNPGNVPSGVLGDVDSFVTMYNMLRTKRE